MTKAEMQNKIDELQNTIDMMNSCVLDPDESLVEIASMNAKIKTLETFNRELWNEKVAMANDAKRINDELCTYKDTFYNMSFIDRLVFLICPKKCLKKLV